MSEMKKGRAVRTEVLGEARVSELLDGADDFNRPFQELVTEYCWGRAWGNDGLTRKQRSLLNIGMLAALNRADEFRLHVKAAIGNGVTLIELREALIQVAIYCGVPAGVEAFRIASEVIADLRDSGVLKI
jgi:4-carboxymuconolactone decarboxylase